MDWNKLTKPFNDEDVFWRIDRSFGSWARVLCYLDARAVMDRLDAAVGPGNWQDKYFETPNGKNMCELSIKVDGEWVTKSDGAGNTNIEGDKGGISDAFKRAGVKWGIGRHLYSLGETKVNLSEQRPGCEKHYLVVASKRGEKTKYGVAPSIQELQKNLYPRGRRIERIRNVLRQEKVDVGDIPLILEAGTAIVKDGEFVKLGLKDVDPNTMNDDRLKILSQRLHGWHEKGMFKEMINKYITFNA
tara:strand:+ start:3498 stop:4232 length:735 start_codon:yes stop_codon:yes gene_type:complete